MLRIGENVRWGSQVVQITDSPSPHMYECLTDEGCTHLLEEHHLSRIEPCEAPHPDPPPPKRDLSNPNPFCTSKTPAETRLRLAKAIMDMRLDWRGHFHNGREWHEGWRWYDSEEERRRSLLSDIKWDTCIASTEDIERILEGEPLPEFITLLRFGKFDCSNCSEKLIFESNGAVIRPTVECPHPQGIKTEWELDFPSGEVVIGDDLSALCRIYAQGSINHRLGKRQRILDFAHAGMVYGFGSGDSATHLYQKGKESYVFGNALKHKKLLSYVCDRAICMLDVEEAERRYAYYYGSEGWDRFLARQKVTQILPGRYRFNYPLERYGANGAQMCFKRIGDAQTPFDFVQADRDFHVDFSHAAYALAKETSPDEIEWMRCCASAICGLVNGGIPERDWHRNGFRLQYKLGQFEGLPTRAIPRFVGRHFSHRKFDALYELCTHSDVRTWGGKLPLNPSHAVAVGRFLENVISFGYIPDRYSTEDERRAGMHRVAGLWRELVLTYPHVVDHMPEFDRWMQCSESVNRWIESIDLSMPTPPQREFVPRWMWSYLLNTPGAGVQVIGGQYAGQRGIAGHKEADPGYAFVDLGEGEVELLLEHLRLTEEEVAKRDTMSEEYRKREAEDQKTLDAYVGDI